MNGLKRVVAVVSMLAATLLSSCAAQPAVVVFGPGSPHYRACAFQIWHAGNGPSGAYMIVQIDPDKRTATTDYPMDRAEIIGSFDGEGRREFRDTAHSADFDGVIGRRFTSYTAALAHIPGTCVSPTRSMRV